MKTIHKILMLVVLIVVLFSNMYLLHTIQVENGIMMERLERIEREIVKIPDKPVLQALPKEFGREA